MERIWVESNKCYCLKDNHMFTTMAVDKLKAFLTKNQWICQNKTKDDFGKKSMVTRTEVLQCKQYLHLVHNSALNSSDKFEKVRPFFNATNELCILNYQPTQHVNVDDSIVPYFGKYGARLYISVKPIKFRFEL